jgi:hypothetical protein
MSKPKVLLIAAVMFLVAATSGIAVAQEAVPISAEPEAEGTAVIFDDVAPSDAIRYSMINVPDPGDGNVYVGWMVSSAVKLSTGEMLVEADAINHVFDSNDPRYTGGNLIHNFNQVVVTLETLGSDPDAPQGPPVWSYTIESAPMTHIRHLLTNWPPGTAKGILTNLKDQLNVAWTHANLASNANTIAGIRQHTEHVINAIEGPDGPNYGDLDGNGAVQDFGEGIGVLAHAVDRQHATFAANTVPDDTIVGNNALGVEAAGKHASDVAEQARDQALNLVLTTSNLTAATLFNATVIGLLDTALNGVDANANGTIESIDGEGGASQAYTSAQLMATYLLAGPGPDPDGGELPPTGDEVLPIVVQMALLASAVLLAGGALLMIRSRRSATIA